MQNRSVVNQRLTTLFCFFGNLITYSVELLLTTSKVINFALCGETGIRTQGTRKSTPHFECGPFDHSGISPFYLCVCKITIIFRTCQIYMKKSEAPATAMMAPTSSCRLTLVPNISRDGHKMRTGVSDIRVCAMPVFVMPTAIRLRLTPKNGQRRMAPIAAKAPLKSVKKRDIVCHLRRNNSVTPKPTSPMIARI